MLAVDATANDELFYHQMAVIYISVDINQQFGQEGKWSFSKKNCCMGTYFCQCDADVSWEAISLRNCRFGARLAVVIFINESLLFSL